ncbi:SHOCT domain-containing protein [Galactobacter valiniphilus]|uniref:SHOCT domain-containing protein n=1 Tax=Galactobacter valiniphilus TaxID=2676122 RepID=UPI003735EF2B
MPFIARSGRPGLLGLAARTAVVAGTAQAVGGAVARRQAHNDSRDVAAAVPAPPSPQPLQPSQTSPAAAPVQAAPATDVVVQLQRLGDLYAQGILTADEFAAAKQQLLGA